METRIILTINLPGAIMLTEKEAAETNSYKEFTVNVLNEKNRRETLNIKTRGNRTAQQVIKMNDNAYDYMTSNEVPEFSNKFMWARMSKNQRLRAHLKNVSDSLGGISFTYEVLDR